ncbi:phage baseplate assembly protein V [Bacteroides pyogenes]|uniref:phage baseplate assembly protein V n=1 Tax=Bacteroides pyogenes TaxID=310300 RepID=UPI002A8121BF|nr:phage baseplate assembly protein V [Bacteroides pyogenes]MDY4250497.1 phage baseplate assembly protein V [Bacteroides pyogenes]
MELSLNPVRPKVRFDGEEFVFESLILEQKMNSCHYFEVVKEFFSQDEMWKAKPEELVGMIGSRALIYLEHLDGSHPYEFSGWITDVQIDSWEDFADSIEYKHRSNKVRIIGQGDVVKLDGTPTMNSYVDKPLSDIVKWVTEKATFEVKCNPKYKGLLPYAMQYGESNFDFLNRLSCTYGELFYYDGRSLFFGTPDDPRSEDLYVDQDLISLRTYSSAVPRKYTGYGYLPMDDKFVRTPEHFKPNSENRLLKTITERSDYLFPDKGVVEAGTAAYNEDHLYDMANSLRLDAAGRMLNIEGQTHTCRIKLGGLINVLFPHKMEVPSLGQYRIIQIVHRIDKNGNYSNHFLAMPSKYEYVPGRFNQKLIAYPEVATVSDNNDPKGQGRVQVQFYWQKPLSLTTNWLRVQTPDAGSSDKVSSNRGLVTIPEVGDQVMIGFEYGDPHRPFVMGSLFHGKAGTGGGSDNNVKSLSSKSGHTVELNDGGGITIKDKTGGNLIVVDGKDSITVASSKTIALSNGKASIVLEEDKIVIDAAKISITGSDIVSAGSGAAGFQLANDGGIAAVSGTKVVASGSSEVQIQGAKTSVSGNNVSINGDMDTIVTGGLVKINS